MFYPFCSDNQDCGSSCLLGYSSICIYKFKYYYLYNVLMETQKLELGKIITQSSSHNELQKGDKQLKFDQIKQAQKIFKQEKWENYSLFSLQVSGKSPKLISLDKKEMLKQYNENEYNFYNVLQNKLEIGHPYRSLVKFMPKLQSLIKLKKQQDTIMPYKYEGDNQQYKIWINYMANRYQFRKKQAKDYSKFMVLDNFLIGYEKPNVIDIKIGVKQEIQIQEKVTQASLKYKFRLNGLLKSQPVNNTLGIPQKSEFLSKSSLKKVVKYDEIKKYIAYFYSCQGVLLQQYIYKMIQQLKQLVLCLKCMRGWKFVSTSICLYYDSVHLSAYIRQKIIPDLHKCRLKYIDFSRTQFCYTNSMMEQSDDKYLSNQDTCKGFLFFIKILKQILEQPNKYTGIVIEKDEQVVPLHKLNKYGCDNLKGSQKRQRSQQTDL